MLTTLHPIMRCGVGIAHDAYHHGEIGFALAQVGHPPDKEVAYGIWDWRSSGENQPASPTAGQINQS